MFIVSILFAIRLFVHLALASSLDSSQLVLAPSDDSTFSSCPSDLPISCHVPPQSSPINACCTNTPGGQMLLTQFWDFHPATGPVDSWTIHGLWPDNCDGSYDASCDAQRAYTNISQILESGGGKEALDFMTTYWRDQRGNDDQFWQHEWGKHGTCISTLQPSCYGTSYTPQCEVVGFFNRTVELFKGLPTYKWLSDAGIVPSVSQTYTLAQLQAVANKHFGHDAVWNCRGHSLNEVWWHFNTVGTVVDGKFLPANPVGPLSSCPHSGIQYIPKSGGGGGGHEPHQPHKPHKPHQPHTPQPPHPHPSDKHFIHVIDSSGKRTGCLIGNGAWYAGTCARYTITSDKLSTRKGPCAFDDEGAMKCSSGLKSHGFSLNGTFLIHEGQQHFYAAVVPVGRSQIKIVKGEAKESIQLEVGPAY